MSLSAIVKDLFQEYLNYILKTHFEPFEDCDPISYREFDCCAYHRKAQETYSELDARCRLLDWLTDVDIKRRFGHEPFSLEWWKDLARISGVPFPEALYKQFFLWDAELYASVLKAEGFLGILIFAATSEIDISYIERCLEAILYPPEMKVVQQYFRWLESAYPDTDALMSLLPDEYMQRNISEEINRLNFGDTR